MAKQAIIWSVLPNGKETSGPMKGRWRVSVVVSPRLTPEKAAEQVLEAFSAEWADWPALVAKLGFQLEVGGTLVKLVPLNRPETARDSALWKRLFWPKLPVAGFQFKDMSQVNLRSFPLRGVLGFVRKHYQTLSLQAGAGEHPTLLPWSAADPGLKGMLGEAGTQVITQNFGSRSISQMAPGFGRFHRESGKKDGRRAHDTAVDTRVFNANSCIKAPVRLSGAAGERGAKGTFPLRALPPEWEDPALIRNGSIQVAPADREPRAQLMEQFSGPAEYALWQSDRFYHRTVVSEAQLAMRRPGFAGGAAAIKAPEFDFHQRIASYGDHPNLLRRLGLIIDCVLESNEAIDGGRVALPTNEGLMRLKVVGAPPHLSAGDLFPQSAWKASKRRFVLRPRTADHQDGLLRLENANDQYQKAKEPSPFDLFQIDPDGAALKTINFLLTAQNLVGKSLVMGAGGEVTYTTGDRQPVATLRSGGIGVSRHGRAGQVAMTAAAAALNNAAVASGGAAAAQVTLYAEDMLRGYRIDVLDKAAGRWRSLTAREGRYSALPRAASEAALPIKLPAEEGYVKGASTTSGEEQPDDHYLHETLFRWTGWSLAAPRPGRTVRDGTVPGTNLQTEEVVDQVDDVAARGNGLAVRFAPVKGSLPKLRFAHEYRVRARLVDVAGNSLALDDADLGALEQASQPINYGRFEPIDPPVLLMRRKLSEGESLERLVLRSTYNRSAVDYAGDISPPSGVWAGFYDNPDFEYGATAERHLVPPKSSQQQCELHGMFDAAIGSADPEQARKAYAIAARESGSLMDQEPGAQIELVTPTKVAKVATVQGAGALILPPDQADDTRDRFAAGQYMVHREPIVPVPYLPDPACGGVALHGVPGLAKLIQGKPLLALAPGLPGVILGKGWRVAILLASKSLVLLLDSDRDPADDPGVNLQNDWPDDVRSLRLVLAEQPDEVSPPPCGDTHTEPNPPKWDFDTGVLTIFLPKGHIARLRYASFAHDKLVGHFGLPRWHAPADCAKLQAEALAGANWMLTPWRRLTLVHATQKPVCPPRLEHVSMNRLPGEQHVDILARLVRLHGPSTGKFEIVASWEEWIDDPLVDEPGKPGPKRVQHEAQLAEIRLDENHPNVFNLADAVRRQTEFTPNGGQVIPLDLAQRPAVPGNRHEFGDTRFRFIRYHLRATTRFREYLPPKLFADLGKITRDGPPLETHHVQIKAHPDLTVGTDPGAPVLDVGFGGGGLPGCIVPASATPEVPELVYIVPTFRWSRPAPSSGTVQSTRYGNGLRVYLERPWFSSGDGELLGVVIPGNDAPFNQIDAARLPFVTQWGMDPLWDSGLPSTRSKLSDFTAAVASENALLLELPTATVHVVGHRVHFDPARKLWYCDIELNPGASYMPFVRLALVRYQPNALPGLRISNVVLAEFAQLLPRRRAVLKREGFKLDISVHGPVPARGPMRRANPGGTSESPHADISFVGLGVAAELGRNRMELVLQMRDETIDSDLAWEDMKVLAEGPADPNAAAITATITSGTPLVQRIDDASLNVRTRSGQTLRFDRLLDRSDAATALTPIAPVKPVKPGQLGDLGAVIGPIDTSMYDPAVWRLSGQIPRLPSGRKIRVMVREFERFYTDRTVPENVGGAVHRRVVVEERLVYAEVFALD